MWTRHSGPFRLDDILFSCLGQYRWEVKFGIRFSLMEYPMFLELSVSRFWSAAGKATLQGGDRFWAYENLYPNLCSIQPSIGGNTYHKGNQSCFSFFVLFVLACLVVNNVVESDRRMICSVKESLILFRCNIGIVLLWFSLCLALLVRDAGRHLSVFLFSFFFFFFWRWKTFTAEECPHPPLKHQALRRLDAAGTVICSFKERTSQCWITLISLHWMLYRRNCNTLLSSSLQRCYINGVCFAFQLATLWKRRSVFVLGNINSH